MEQGTVIRSISGFYDVYSGTGVTRCRARGKLRQGAISPLVGDHVEFEKSGPDAGYLINILDRKNSFIRPAVANIDLLVMMAAEVNPITDPFLIDRIGVIAAARGVETLLVLTKSDLKRPDTLLSIYEHTGIPVLVTSAVTGEGMDRLHEAVAGKCSAFTGNSGIGKSTMLNRLFPGANIPTGEVSEKLGRGRHTTRHVELYTLPDGTMIMDTPGFSSFDIGMMELCEPKELAGLFTDFLPYIDSCRFDDCAHIKEDGCALCEALARGKIQKSRHDSYVRLYHQLKEVNPWEVKRERKKS